MDDATVAALGVVAEAIAASPSELLGREGVGFEPVDDKSRHMTFVFFGEHLQQLSASELLAVHAAICEEVAAVSVSAAAPLAFHGFQLFPPGKSNLVVACFEPSPSLLELRHAVLRRVRECGLSLPKSFFAMLEGEGRWMPHVTLGKVRASKVQIGGVSCSPATFHSLVPTAPAMPLGLTMLGAPPVRVRCNWDSALEFCHLASRGRIDADSEDVQAIHLTSHRAFDTPPTLEILNASHIASKSKDSHKTDANPAQESIPEQLPAELEKDASLHQSSADLFVKCKVNAISATRKQSLCLVEVERSDSGACMQVVVARPDVAVGQVWLVALPGATLQDGQKVKQTKIAGEWSEGALVEIIPEMTPPTKSLSFAKEMSNNQPEDGWVSPYERGNASGGIASTNGKYCVLSGIKAAGVPGTSPVIENGSDRDWLHIVTGDATIAQYGKGRKIIAHVCNDRGRWGKGFVMAISDKWPEAARVYRQWHKAGVNEGFALGAVQLVELTPSLTLANMIGQNGIKTGSKGPPVRYDALEEALMAVGAHAVLEGASIHMPRIGTGLAGGEWQKIENLLRNMLELYRVHVYVYDYRA